MYVCNDPVCDPVCDFCWFCVHDEDGSPVYCSIDDTNDVNSGYCDEFKCRLHEKQPILRKKP